MSKRNFYKIFQSSWCTSFTESNIQGGFAKTGIWPFLPAIILNTIKHRPETPPEAQGELPRLFSTPMTSKSIRQAQREYKANPTKETLDAIFRSQERLAAQYEIDKYMKQGLLETLKDEKKKRKRGKRLNLVGGEDNGAQLFDSARVRTALNYQEEKDAIVIVEKAKKDTKKMQIVENKKRKEEEAQEKALQRQIVREVKTVTFATNIEVISEKEGSEMTQT